MIYIVQTQDIAEDRLTTMLNDYKIQGDEAMPTLAERWEERGVKKGVKKGVIRGKQNTLIMLLSTRFQLTEDEQQLIKAVSDAEKLDNALKMLMTTDNKESVLNSLKQ